MGTCFIHPPCSSTVSTSSISNYHYRRAPSLRIYQDNQPRSATWPFHASFCPSITTATLRSKNAGAYGTTKPQGVRMRRSATTAFQLYAHKSVSAISGAEHNIYRLIRLGRARGELLARLSHRLELSPTVFRFIESRLCLSHRDHSKKNNSPLKCIHFNMQPKFERGGGRERSFVNALCQGRRCRTRIWRLGLTTTALAPMGKMNTGTICGHDTHFQLWLVPRETRAISIYQSKECSLGSTFPCMPQGEP